MREDNLLCLRRRKFVVATTNSNHTRPVYPNLAQGMTLTGINQLWVADITYIRLELEFVYLAVILDVFSRRVIGWALDRTLEDELTIAALRMALENRSPAPGLVHHSDRGVQYASGDYTGLLKDNQITISMSRKGKVYPDALRRVSYLDVETRKRFRFLTNNFVLPAHTIARIYKCRWQVELFFKWIKQHLRIKAFFGTSENAVKTQIWIAVSVYVLVAIIRKRLELPASLYQILQVLSLTLFEKTPLLQALQPSDSQEELVDSGKQLILFDF